MDENFISRAFATMGETVMSVKIIRNRLTGYTSLFIFPFSSRLIEPAATVIQGNKYGGSKSFSPSLAVVKEPQRVAYRAEALSISGVEYPSDSGQDAGTYF